MVAHAFFKGLLFLGAGSVIHGLEDEQDLKRMGALRRYMKWTTVTFTIGFLAIAGIPPLSGFWAKGDVLDNVYAHYKLLWVLGLVTAVLTAYYMSRLEILAFGGEPRFDKIGPHGEPALHAPHESPWIMRLPLVVLAFFAFFGGVLDLPWVHTHNLESWLAPVFAGTLYNDHLERRPPSGPWRSPTSRPRSSASSWPSGCGGAPRSTSRRSSRQFLQRVWYWDDFYDTIIGRPEPAAGHLLRLGGRRPDHRRRRQRHGAPGQGRPAPRPASCRPATPATTRWASPSGMALIIAFMLSRTWWG